MDCICSGYHTTIASMSSYSPCTAFFPLLCLLTARVLHISLLLQTIGWMKGRTKKKRFGLYWNNPIAFYRVELYRNNQLPFPRLNLFSLVNFRKEQNMFLMLFFYHVFFTVVDKITWNLLIKLLRLHRRWCLGGYTRAWSMVKLMGLTSKYWRKVLMRWATHTRHWVRTLTGLKRSMVCYCLDNYKCLCTCTVELGNG